MESQQQPGKAGRGYAMSWTACARPVIVFLISQVSIHLLPLWALDTDASH